MLAERLQSLTRCPLFSARTWLHPPRIQWRPHCSWLSGHNQPPNLVIRWAVNEAVFSANAHRLLASCASRETPVVNSSILIIIQVRSGLIPLRISRNRNNSNGDHRLCSRRGWGIRRRLHVAHAGGTFDPLPPCRCVPISSQVEPSREGGEV